MIEVGLPGRRTEHWRYMLVTERWTLNIEIVLKY